MGWTPPGGIDVPWWRVVEHRCEGGAAMGEVSIIGPDLATNNDHTLHRLTFKTWVPAKGGCINGSSRR